MTSPIYTALFDAIHSAIESAYYDDTTTIHDYAHVATEAAMKACGPRALVWRQQSHDCYVARTVSGDAVVQNESHALAPDRWGWWQAGSDEDDSPTGYAATRIKAQAAAQALVVATHWANTVIGAEVSNG